MRVQEVKDLAEVAQVGAVRELEVVTSNLSVLKALNSSQLALSPLSIDRRTDRVDVADKQVDGDPTDVFKRHHRCPFLTRFSVLSQSEFGVELRELVLDLPLHHVLHSLPRDRLTVSDADLLDSHANDEVFSIANGVQVSFPIGTVKGLDS